MLEGTVLLNFQYNTNKMKTLSQVHLLDVDICGDIVVCLYPRYLKLLSLYLWPHNYVCK